MHCKASETGHRGLVILVPHKLVTLEGRAADPEPALDVLLVACPDVLTLPLLSRLLLCLDLFQPFSFCECVCVCLCCLSAQM